MNWIYILIVLVVAAFTLGCIDKNQAETSLANTDQTSILPGVSAVTPTEAPLTPEPGEDLGTYSDLAEMDNISGDLDMQIDLSNEI